jgi:hypothetical protein
MGGYRQTSVRQTLVRHNGCARAFRACVAAGALVLLAGGALAQQDKPQSQPAPASPGPGGGGFIDAFGRWIQDSVTNWNTGVKGTADAAGDVAKGMADVTRDTAGAVVRIPGARFVNAREVCPLAPNGAPDCRVAAEAICKANGFASGSSADFQTYQKCPPIALNRTDGEPPPPCVIESAVTRALCQ